MSGRRGTAWTVAGRRAVAVAGRRAVAVGVAVGLLAACGGSPEVEPSTPPTQAEVTPSPTPTPTPTAAPETIPPERPAAMGRMDAQGAEAAALYFTALYPYAYATGDLSDWRALSHPDCAYCTSVIESIEATAAAGETVTGGMFIVDEASARQLDSGTVFAAEVRGHQQPWRYLDAAGELLEESLEPIEHTFHFAMRAEGGAWVVKAVQVDGPPT